MSVCVATSQIITFVDVGVQVAVLLGVCSDLLIVFINEDTHLCQQLHLLLIQVVCGDLRHSDGWMRMSHRAAEQSRTHRLESIHCLIL